MAKIPLKLIESFMTYAQELNMVRAAKILNITQPALSRQLQDFERHTGQSIFKNSGRNKALTHFGQEVYNKLSLQWVDYSYAIEEVSNLFTEKPQEMIKIYGPVDFIARLAENLKYPHPLSFVPAESDQMEELLSKNEINLGVGRIFNKQSNLIAKPVEEYEFYLAFPKAWKVSEKTFGIKMLKSVAKFPRVAFRKDSLNKKLLEMLDQVQINYQTLIPNWRVIINLIAAGKGWSLIPHDIIQTYITHSSAIQIVKVPHEIIQPVPYYLIYRKDLVDIKWFKELADEIIQLTRKV